ncbi:unnamed protein product [Sympodiomycopsis kandeliae]
MELTLPRLIAQTENLQVVLVNVTRLLINSLLRVFTFPSDRRDQKVGVYAINAGHGRHASEIFMPDI